MLSISRVTKKYGKSIVLNDISAHFAEKGVTLISGQNGSGKTTLIRCILGLESFSGSINWLDAPVDTRERTFFPVFDDAAAHQRLTGLQNLKILLGDVRSALSNNYLDEHLLATKVAAYSYGQRKRLMLMAALGSGAPYLVLDEPFDGLDEEGTRRLRADLARLGAAGGVLITGHGLTPDDQLFDHAFRLDLGALTRIDGAPHATHEGVAVACSGGH